LFSGARDNEIKLWDVTTGTELRSIKGHRGDINAMTFLDESERKLLTGCNDSFMRVWALAEYGGDDASVAAAARARADEMTHIGQAAPDVAAADASEAAAKAAALADVAVGGDVLSAEQTAAALAGGFAIGNAAGDRVVAQYAAHSYDIAHMAHHAGRRLAATSTTPSEVRIYDIGKPTAPTLLHEFAGHGEFVSDVLVVTPDVALSASHDYHIGLYNLVDFTRLAHFNFEGSVERLALTPDRKNVIAGGNHYDIKMYNIDATAADGVRYAEVARFVGHAGKVEALAVSPNGEWLVSGGHDFDIRYQSLPIDRAHLIQQQQQTILLHRLWPISSKKVNKSDELTIVSCYPPPPFVSTLTHFVVDQISFNH
jgi:WD40 repeat protein